MLLFGLFWRKVNRRSTGFVWIPFPRQFWASHHLDISRTWLHDPCRQHYDQAKALLDQGEIEPAVAVLRQALESATPFEALLLREAVAIAQFCAGHLVEAKQSIEACLATMEQIPGRAIPCHGMDNELQCIKGVILKDLGDLDESLLELTEATAAKKSRGELGDPICEAYLGMTLIQMGKLNSALPVLRAAAYLAAQFGHGYCEVACDCWAYMAEAYGRLALQIAAASADRGMDNRFVDCVESVTKCWNNEISYFRGCHGALKSTIMDCNQGVLSYLGGDPKRGLKMLVLAPGEFTQLGDTQRTAIAMQNLRIIYDDVGEKRVAKVCQQGGIGKEVTQGLIAQIREL